MQAMKGGSTTREYPLRQLWRIAAKTFSFELDFYDLKSLRKFLGYSPIHLSETLCTRRCTWLFLLKHELVFWTEPISDGLNLVFVNGVFRSPTAPLGAMIQTRCSLNGIFWSRTYTPDAMSCVTGIYSTMFKVAVGKNLYLHSNQLRFVGVRAPLSMVS